MFSDAGIPSHGHTGCFNAIDLVANSMCKFLYMQICRNILEES